jgi:hypothetical protein
MLREKRMNLKLALLGLTIGLFCFLLGCQIPTTLTSYLEGDIDTAIVEIADFSAFQANEVPYFAPLGPSQKSIRAISNYPNLPASYAYFDYRQKAIDADRVLFGFAGNPTALQPSFNPYDDSTWNPIGFWIDQPRQPSNYDPLTTGYLRRTFGLPTYLGDNRVVSSGTEPLTVLASVLGSSFAGIDKSNQTIGTQLLDFVEMTLASYDTGSKLVHNVGVQGQSFWYDIFPQILFARLYDFYPDTDYMREMVLNGADEWLEALPYFVIDGQPNFEFVGYNVVLESPTLVGRHIEPPNGGLAFLFYSAYEMTQEAKYLDGAKEVLDYLESYEKNPNYEAMTDYAPFVAAALNSKYGTNYDVGKFLDFLFETDSAFRPGWAVMSGTFGGYAVEGLVGQANDYAFAMNSFHLASVLAPMVKYDSRYASAIGKYLLHLVNNAKVFFPQTLPLVRQTMTRYLPYDLSGSLCYEGFRRNYNGIDGLAMGDATAMFSQPSDLSIYSTAFIGALGGIVESTNVNGILQIDLNQTDSFGRNDYDQYLYYNPYSTDRTIKFVGADQRYDLFDAVNKRVVARNVSGTVNVTIPAEASSLLVVLPAKSQFFLSGSDILVGNVIVAQIQVAVSLPTLASRQELTSSSAIQIRYSSPVSDPIVKMDLYFGSILVYSGNPVTSFSYNKALLPDTDYTFRVVITSDKGRVDVATKRVIAR